MKYSVLTFLILALIMASCKENSQVKITYQTSGAISEYELNYIDSEGVMSHADVFPQSAQDKWTYSFTGEQGDIVYVSGKYADPNSGLNIMIKVNGKIYKQASNEGDTLKYLTVSGVVPFGDN